MREDTPALVQHQCSKNLRTANTLSKQRMKVSLSQVPLRTPCTVVSLIEGELSTRMMELGIIPETKLEVLFSAPGGCPIAVLIDETYLLGLRREEADRVTVYLDK